MKIFILIVSLYTFSFASVSNSIDSMNTNINELDRLYTEQNKKYNISLALDKDKALDFSFLVFLLAKHNQLLINYLKIKGQ